MTDDHSTTEPSTVSIDQNKSPSLPERKVCYALKVEKRLLERKGNDSLADSGANVNIVNNNVSVVDRTDRYVDVSGIQNHTVNELNIIHAAFVAESQHGPTICHQPESVHMPEGKIILSVPQMEAFGTKVVTKSAKIEKDVHPHIMTPDGYVFPLKVREGLAYMETRPVLESEWDTLPHTYMCSESPWTPTNHDHPIHPEWVKMVPIPKDKFVELPYDRDGILDAEKEDYPIKKKEEDACH